VERLKHETGNKIPRRSAPQRQISPRIHQPHQQLPLPSLYPPAHTVNSSTHTQTATARRVVDGGRGAAADNSQLKFGDIFDLLLSHGNHVTWTEFVGGERLRDDDV
jgi:hypothetical protein